jgi:hypothetical protein
MKFESLMLHSLFAACMLICVLVLGAMLTSHVSVPNTTASHAQVATSSAS